MSKKAFPSRAGETKIPYSPGPRTFQVAEDIIPIAEFKAKISDVVRALDERPRPLVVTLNGKPAAVVMSPREYDQIRYREQVLTSLAQGLTDDAAGRHFTTEEVRARLRARLGSSVTPKKVRR